MERYITFAKIVSKSLEENHKEYLQDIGLNEIFEGIYKLGFPQVDENRLLAFIIFSYDPDSEKLNIQKDRYENKYQILKGLGADADNDLMQEILTNSNEDFNNIVLNFLETLTNWKWISIYSYLDYHSNMTRFANQKTEAEKSYEKMNKEGIIKTITSDYDIDVLTKVNKSKGELLNQALDARKKADLLLGEIRTEFMPTNHATQSDFGFEFTETAKKKVEIESWRSFIRDRNERK